MSRHSGRGLEASEGLTRTNVQGGGLNDRSAPRWVYGPGVGHDTVSRVGHHHRPAGRQGVADAGTSSEHVYPIVYRERSGDQDRA